MKKKEPVSHGTEKITFAKDLLVPPQSQVQLYEDSVSSTIRELDAAASQLARGFGIGFLPGMQLNKMSEPASGGLELLALLIVPTQRVSLEKLNGNWGLVYSFEPAAFRTNERAYRVPLRDAPLEIREKFLTISEEFFRNYLATCEGRLSSMKLAVGAGNKTLALLRRIELQ